MTDFESMCQPPDDPSLDVVESVDLFHAELIGGKYGKVQAVAMVIIDGRGALQVFSFGQVSGSDTQVCGLLSLGQAEIFRQLYIDRE